MSIQLIRAQIAQHKAAECQSHKADSDLAWRIESPAYIALLQKRLDWLTELQRLQTKLSDTIQARSDLE